MYGDTSRLRTQAANTRENATQLRSRASALLTQVETMAWASSAGDALRTRIRAVALELGGEAQLLDDAAAQLEAHATAVEKVKAAIEAARIAVEDAWNRAANVAGNVIETTKDIAVSAVETVMKTIGSALSGAADEVRVHMFTLAGQLVPEEAVQVARNVMRTVPVLPPAGSREWLDLDGTFTIQGWK
jgi:F0F1-type ATP synthase membrane subunit b/b'